MKLLIDTDAFCKLGVVGLLEEAVGVFGVALGDCGRLPALPHMLRRGSLRRVYGEAACDALIPAAESMPTMPRGVGPWLDAMALIDAIDPGEVQLFAAAAKFGLEVISGDKRAIGAIKGVADLAESLAGRVVTLEAILLALRDRLGDDELRRRMPPLAGDAMITACFSAGNLAPRDGLGSYYREMAARVAPLLLWSPYIGGK